MPHDTNDAATDHSSTAAETYRYTPEELLTTLLEDRGDIAQIHATVENGSVVLTVHTAIEIDDHTVVDVVDRNDLVLPELSDRTWRIHAVETNFGPKPVDGFGTVVFYRHTDEEVTAEEGIKRLRDRLTDTL